MLLVPSHIPSTITVSEKANGFLLQVPLTADSTLWPQSMPGLHMVLARNVMELTAPKQLLANDRKAVVDKYPSFFPLWGDNSITVLYVIFQKTPGGIEPQLSPVVMYALMHPLMAFFLLPLFPSPLPYQCFLR